MKSINLGINPLLLSTQVLTEKLFGQMTSRLMRSILRAEIATCKRESPEQRTMRNLWYDLVKPILSRIGELGRFEDKPSYDWDMFLSKYLVELVDAGETDYKLLGIVDSSRQRSLPGYTNLTARQLGYDFMTTSVVEPHDPGILLISEKDTIYNVVDQVASIYGVGSYSCGGQSSYAAVEDYLYNVAKKFTCKTIYLLAITDYDPAGDNIYNAVVEQVAKTMVRCGLTELVPRRIGINPDQLPEERLLQNAYTPKKKGLAKWFAKTGGVMGQPLGLELDSLSFTELREMYVDAVEDVLASHDPHFETIAKATVKMLIFEAMKDEVQERYQSIYDRIDGDSLVDGMTCDTDVIADFAKKGDPYIDPIDDDIFEEVANVRTKISDLLKEENGNE